MLYIEENCLIQAKAGILLRGGSIIIDVDIIVPCIVMWKLLGYGLNSDVGTI